MTRPKVPRDLSLAPVAVSIDTNLERIRELDGEALRGELELELDRPTGGLRARSAEIRFCGPPYGTSIFMGGTQRSPLTARVCVSTGDLSRWTSASAPPSCATSKGRVKRPPSPRSVLIHASLPERLPTFVTLRQMLSVTPGKRRNGFADVV